MVQAISDNPNDGIKSYSVTVDPKYILVEAHDYGDEYAYVHLHSLTEIPESIDQVIKRYLLARKLHLGY